jgi:hypothetical protein
MEASNLKKASILAVVLVIVSIASWELHLRNSGYSLSYDDGEPLWADKRALVYQPSDKATVFIGASRNKFDLDIATWKKLTGENAVQLAIEGESPTPILEDLANDKNFKGKLVVDVTEDLFFSTSPNDLTTPNKYIKNYKERTPAERASFEVNHLLESQFVFLDKNYFSLNSLLKKLPVPERKGVYGGPDFPWEFSKKNFERQSCMDPRFLKDSNLPKKVQNIWLAFEKAFPINPPAGARLDSFLNAMKTDVDKIKERGGQVIFLRTPSSNHYLEVEKKYFPREKYWEKLLAITNCNGIHFEDYEPIAHFICPEWSHLSQPQAVVWTTNIVQILQDKGWTFSHKQTTAQNTLTQKTFSHGF